VLTNDDDILLDFYADYKVSRCFFLSGQTVARKYRVSVDYVNQLHRAAGYYNPITGVNEIDYRGISN
jgi:hypothetical protein